MAEAAATHIAGNGTEARLEVPASTGTHITTRKHLPTGPKEKRERLVATGIHAIKETHVLVVSVITTMAERKEDTPPEEDPVPVAEAFTVEGSVVEVPTAVVAHIANRANRTYFRDLMI